MQHMVIFRSAEGKPDYHQADELDSAVKFVEHLRNVEQVTDARIFRMEEVAIEVKAYYKVEVAAEAPAPPPLPEAAAAAPVAEMTPAAEIAPALDALLTRPAVTSARFGLFGRS